MKWRAFDCIKKMVHIRIFRDVCGRFSNRLRTLHCEEKIGLIVATRLSRWITRRGLVPGGTRTARQRRTMSESSVNAAFISARFMK
jgi:hypothetical protein